MEIHCYTVVLAFPIAGDRTADGSISATHPIQALKELGLKGEFIESEGAVSVSMPSGKALPCQSRAALVQKFAMS